MWMWSKVEEMKHDVAAQAASAVYGQDQSDLSVVADGMRDHKYSEQKS
jgi:hypothetical protein